MKSFLFLNSTLSVAASIIVKCKGRIFEIDLVFFWINYTSFDIVSFSGIVRMGN